MHYNEFLERRYSLTSGMKLDFRRKLIYGRLEEEIVISRPDRGQIFYKSVITSPTDRDINLGTVSGVEDDFSKILEDADEVTKAELESLPLEVKLVLEATDSEKEA